MVFIRKGDEVLSEVISWRCTPEEKAIWNAAVEARKQKYGKEDCRSFSLAMLKYCSNSLVGFFTGVKYK